MINFENLHKSKKQAFVDGLATATVIAYFVTKYRDSRKDSARQQSLLEHRHEDHENGFKDGWSWCRIDLLPYIDMEHYEKIRGPYTTE